MWVGSWGHLDILFPSEPCSGAGLGLHTTLSPSLTDLRMEPAHGFAVTMLQSTQYKGASIQQVLNKCWLH
jgi:hypothetical protein